MKKSRSLLVTIILCMLVIGLPQIVNSQNETEMKPDGVLFPRMTTAKRDALSAVTGQFIYNLNTSSLNYYNGIQWIDVSKDSLWIQVGEDIQNANSGNIAIGDEQPLWQLFVHDSGNALNANGTHVQIDSLALVISRKNNTTQEGVGLGFQSSFLANNETSPNIGAAIIHERTSTNSKGKLHFATKTTLDPNIDIPIHMTIDDQSFVGIGTTTPTDKFQIDAKTGEDAMCVRVDGSTKLRVLSSGEVGIGTSAPTDILHVEANTGEDALRIRVDGSTKFRVLSSGNVGIGLTNPNWQVEVHDTSNAITGDNVDISNLALVLSKRQNENNEAIGLGFQSTSSIGSVGAAIIHERTAGNSRGKLHFATKNNPASNVDIPIHMTIDQDGSVGLGTTEPDSKLEVDGGDIRVTGGSFIDDGTTLNVPDYVFAENYALKPLDEVESFILENKHLEGFPSMYNIKGWADISLQARDMKILEKVEELFLYIITQEKEKQDLLSILDKQQNQINELEEKLNALLDEN